MPKDFHFPMTAELGTSAAMDAKQQAGRGARYWQVAGRLRAAGVGRHSGGAGDAQPEMYHAQSLTDSIYYSALTYLHFPDLTVRAEGGCHGAPRARAAPGLRG
jgi:hypothetical protein